MVDDGSDLNDSVMNFIAFANRKFSSILAKSRISFIFRYQIVQLNTIVYRIIFQTNSRDFYELTASSPSGFSSESDIELLKWAKLFDGYHLVTSEEIKSFKAENERVVAYTNDYIKQHLKWSSTQKDIFIDSMITRELPKIGRSYKIIISRPIQFVIILIVDSKG